MSWFSKQKKEEKSKEFSKLPELPESNGNLSPPLIWEKSSGFDELTNHKDLQNSPKLPELEINALPPSPNLSDKKTFNHETIKSAINNPEKMQKSKFADINNSRKFTEEIPLKSTESNSETTKSFVKKLEPIYVRLDKFETAVETFEEIKNKINEIEELLKKTKEIKLKEEQELIEWEREIKIIKMKIDSIDKNIFNKLD